MPCLPACLPAGKSCLPPLQGPVSTGPCSPLPNKTPYAAAAALTTGLASYSSALP